MTSAEYPNDKKFLEIHPKMVMNAVSRREDIYICSNCGADEAVKDFRKEGPLQITEWAIRGSVIDDAHYEWLTGGAIE